MVEISQNLIIYDWTIPFFDHWHWTIVGKWMSVIPIHFQYPNGIYSKWF